MEKILTVVIPSYNVEKFLDTTLKSFICDEDVMEKFEVIVVDDGSKDKTSEIGQTYADKYPGTFKVISKENGGHGSTINCGIKNAQGKYFKVVDGDDWVNTKDFVELIKRLEECNSEYVVANYFEYYDDINQQKEISVGNYEDNKQYKFKDIADNPCIPMHALVIRTDILRDNNIRLDEKCFYVDVEYVMFPLPYVENMTYFNLYVYMYRLNLNTQSVSIDGFKKHIEDHIRVCLHMLDFLNEYKHSDKAVDSVVNHITRRVAEIVCTQSVIFSSFDLNDENIKAKFIEFDKAVKEKSPEVYALSSQMSKKLKLLRQFNFKHYKLIQKISLKLSK